METSDPSAPAPDAPKNTRLPLLGDTTPNQDVSRALRSAVSSERARDLAKLQKERRKPGETHYEIRYYLYESANGPVPKNTIDNVTETNPLTPINTQMFTAIDISLAAIASQLPGRFVFKRVDDPEQADMTFSAVKELYDIERNEKGEPLRDSKGQVQHSDSAGMANKLNGQVILNGSAFAGPLDSDMIHTALHEIGHALGLEHPQASKDKQGHDNNQASYFDSIMTYGSNNERSARPLDRGPSARHSLYPNSLMAADLDALMKLYPLPADDQLVVIDNAANAYEKVEAMVQLTDAAGRTSVIRFPDRGTVYQAAQDSTNDTLTFSGILRPRTELDIKLLDAGWSGVNGYVRVTPGINGVQIRQPYHQGNTLVPIRPEKIVLNAELPFHVAIDSDTHVVLPRSKQESLMEDWVNCWVTISGKNNIITAPASELMGDAKSMITVMPGAQLQVNITDAAALLDKQEFRLRGFIVPDVTSREADGATATIRWYKEPDGQYHLRVAPLDAGRYQPMDIAIRLDTQDPQVHARFQWMLNQPMVVQGEMIELKPHSMPGVHDDDGWRTITPQQIEKSQMKVNPVLDNLPPMPKLRPESISRER